MAETQEFRLEEQRVMFCSIPGPGSLSKNFKLKTTPFCTASPLYSTSTYSGLFECLRFSPLAPVDGGHELQWELYIEASTLLGKT